MSKFMGTPKTQRPAPPPPPIQEAEVPTESADQRRKKKGGGKTRLTKSGDEQSLGGGVINRPGSFTSGSKLLG
jgi:hypothetical protein